MTKPTGRPRGRPPKIKPDIEAERPAVASRRRNIAAMVQVFGAMTAEEIETLLPRDIFRLLVKMSIIAKDDKMLHTLARDWAPYEHARKSETVTFTPEEVRRLADAARLEASRRGMVIDIAGQRAA